MASGHDFGLMKTMGYHPGSFFGALHIVSLASVISAAGFASAWSSVEG